MMRKTTKVWLITAAALVLLGCILFAGVMTTLKWDFSKLSTVRYETNTHEVGEPFVNISLTTDNADIIFALSGDGKCKVECHEEENATHSVTVENNTLTININDRRSWYDYAGFHFGSKKITVYLPKTEYDTLSVRKSTGNIEIPKDFAFADADISVSTGCVNFFAAAREAVRIVTTTGNIRVENTAVGSLDLSATTGAVTVSGVNCRDDITLTVSTGKTDLTDISCRSMTSRGTTGDISLNNVIAAEKLSVERSTGYVRFDGCDAAGLYIKTTTGSVTGSLLTDKVFITETATGNVEVPKTASGGRCEIRTTTGNIKIKTK